MKDLKSVEIKPLDNGFITEASFGTYGNEKETLSHKSIGEVAVYVLERFTFKPEVIKDNE